MANELHVGNLAKQVSDQQLHDLFAGAGHVTSARVITDGQTNESRGFGLVEMATHEDAQAAVRAIDGHRVEGRLLTVRPSIPRNPGWEGGNGEGGRNRSHGFGAGNGGSRW